MLCFQGGSAMDSLLYAGYRPHPAGLLLLHWAAAGRGGGGGSREEPDTATGEQDQAAAEHAAGQDILLMMDYRLTMEDRKHTQKKQEVNACLCHSLLCRHFRQSLLIVTYSLALLHFFAPFVSGHKKLFLRKHFYSHVTFSDVDE